MTPGRKFSTTTSAEATSRRTASTAAGDLRSSAMLFLPALSCPKLVLAPLRNGGRVRIISPSGASILIPSAPRSARMRAQWGPAIVVVKSSTRRPSKALLLFIRSLPIWASPQPPDRGANVKPPSDPLPISGLLLLGLGAKRAAAFGGRLKMAFRNIQAGMATYRGQGGDRGDAYYAHPSNAGPHPGVVVIHHMPGWDEWTCEVARKFAHHGYAAVAPSLYFRVGDGADEAVVAKVRESGGVPDEQMLGDVTGAIDFLRSQPHASGKVGVIGFCSGGRQTYLVACRLSHLVQGPVDCWGGNVVVDDKSRLTKAQPVAPIDLTEGINCPLLGLFGNEDPNPTPEHVNKTEAELKKHGKNYEFHRYDGAGHAFFAWYRPNYRPEQAIDGWQKVFTFFEKFLASSR